MDDLVVSRIVGGDLLPVGDIDRRETGLPAFAYRQSYLESEHAIALSSSLPLREKPYEGHELRAYFEGLLPEGAMRTALAARVGAREDDYLTLLASSGLDCIGDVVVREASEGTEWDAGYFAPIDAAQLQDIFSGLESMTQSNVESRLSLAGTQGKVGLAHLPDTNLADGWLLPLGGAASTHILKASSPSRIEELELVCMEAAEACGVRVARSDALMLGKPCISSERYDRIANVDAGFLRVERLHQEDLAQAFGVTPGLKYSELEGGSYHAIAQLLYERSSAALADVNQLAHIAVFDYLIGNCDNHLKNLSVMYSDRALRLAPAYDLVCTTYFERFSREMGRRLGSTRMIDDVAASDFDLLARDLGMGRRRMRAICGEMRERIVPAVLAAGERFSNVIEALPYTAEDLVADMKPRLAVLA